MSSEVSANRHTKVRYNQRMEEDRAQREEREVVIYDNADCVRHARNNFQSQEGVSAGPQTQNHPPVHIKSFKGAALCLGVLCLLMTAVIIVLSTYHILLTTEKQQFSIFKEQLQTRLNNSYSQSQNKSKQLQAQITEISVNNSRLQDEIKKLKIKTKECPDGWKQFGSSCYFKSTEKKSWSESRRDCENRGSDLVMINSKEEQEFVSGLSKNDSWIGLRTTENKTSSTGFRWEWVDDSLPTEMFWDRTAELENPTGLNVASCCDQQGKWTRSGYNDNVKKNWICEK